MHLWARHEAAARAADRNPDFLCHAVDLTNPPHIVMRNVRGAYASTGGKSFICMSSTYERHGVRASRVLVDLTPGNVITTTRADLMYVVTEYGIVNLKGQIHPRASQSDDLDRTP